MNEPHELRPPHKCKPIAKINNMAEGRDWWLGELTEPFYAPDGAEETHCMHIKTPFKEIWLLCNMGDLQGLAVLVDVPFPILNQRWKDRMTTNYKHSANKEQHGPRKT